MAKDFLLKVLELLKLPKSAFLAEEYSSFLEDFSLEIVEVYFANGGAVSPFYIVDVSFFDNDYFLWFLIFLFINLKFIMEK